MMAPHADRQMDDHMSEITSSPLVSIVIPIHNAEGFIRQTLAAIVKNSPESIELVLVFDNCSDESSDVAQAYLEQVATVQFQIAHTQFGSTALSRNHGIDIANGDFVAFVDHDDIVDSAMYQRMLDFVQDADADVVRCGFSIVKEDQSMQIVEILPGRTAYPFDGIFIWNGMFRRAFLNEHNIRFKPGYGEDYEFNLALLACDAREGRIESQSSYYQWRHHGNNLHKSRTASDFISRIESILESHGEFLNSNQEVMGHLVTWVSNYIVYLGRSGHLDDVAIAYTQSEPVHTLMSGEKQILISSGDVRRLLRSVEPAEFKENMSRMDRLNDLVKPSKLGGAMRRALGFARSQAARVRNIYINTGGFVAMSVYISRRIAQRLRANVAPPQQDSQLIEDRISFLNSHTGPKAIFFVFRQEYISGGLISIYSIASKLRQNGIESVMVGDPGTGTVPRNRLFPNQEVTVPWSDFVAADWSDIKYVMLPENKAAEFADLAEQNDLKFPDGIINILNQNNLYMPDEDVIERLRAHGREVTMTTAHLKYSTQEVADRWQVPLKHISTYLSYRDFMIQPFSEKRELILFSVDAHPMKERIISAVSEAFPEYEARVIVGLNYGDYKTLVRRAQFCISFGEGMDNYFIEPFFSNGIGVTVYNPDFMPVEFLDFENVFSSYADMEREIEGFITRVVEDPEFRHSVWKKNFDVLKAIYDGRIYDRKVSEYLSGEYDFLPVPRS